LTIFPMHYGPGSRLSP